MSVAGTANMRRSNIEVGAYGKPCSLAVAKRLRLHVRDSWVGGGLSVRGHCENGCKEPLQVYMCTNTLVARSAARSAGLGYLQTGRHERRTCSDDASKVRIPGKTEGMEVFFNGKMQIFSNRCLLQCVRLKSSETAMMAICSCTVCRMHLLLCCFYACLRCLPPTCVDILCTIRDRFRLPHVDGHRAHVLPK
jgi:hypothetical protein